MLKRFNFLLLHALYKIKHCRKCVIWDFHNIVDKDQSLLQFHVLLIGNFTNALRTLLRRFSGYLWNISRIISQHRVISQETNLHVRKFLQVITRVDIFARFLSFVLLFFVNTFTAVQTQSPLALYFIQDDMFRLSADYCHPWLCHISCPYILNTEILYFLCYSCKKQTVYLFYLSYKQGCGCM